ncbi:penicillin-binding transpeptidase domain-containing protein [Tepidibacillus fermentans]|nr:penicillin-binding transpeptidase domain-containing protein [Tepidibacillus fermentans]
MKKKAKKPIAIRRMNLLFFLVFLFFAGIIFRLSFVQLVEGKNYKTLANTYREKSIPITAPRGLIKDANHQVLVNNKTIWTVTFQINEQQKQDYDQIAETLANLVVKPGEKKEEVKKTILENMDIGPFYKDSKYIPRTILEDVDEKTRAYIEEHKEELPGVEVIPDQMRNYLYKDFMAQTIGYTRKIPAGELEYYQALGYKSSDRIGKQGLEKQYESVLHGKDGYSLVEVNSSYEAIRQKDYVAPVPGNNLILTINKNFQDAVEKALADQVNALRPKYKDVKVGMAVVMNPKTGAVLALANYPRYDLNIWNGLVSQQLYEQIRDYEPNHAIQSGHPVGSTYKPLTILTGLQEKVITTGTIIQDTGRLQYDRRADGSAIVMKNFDGHVYGSLNIQKALQKSSNIFMAEIALRMKQKYGIEKTLERQRYYDHMFGLGVKTGIDLPEETTGITSSAPNYVQHSIGQHDTFTVMQLAQYVSTIANNGYRMKPYLVQAIEEGTQSGTGGRIIYHHEPEVLNKIPMSDQYIQAVKQGMYLVTQPGGTAYSALKGIPIKVGAKTGTAQAANRNKDDNAVFIGFAPYDDPEIAFAILIPYGGTGGSSAGPVARAIVQAYIQQEQIDVTEASVNQQTPTSTP